MLLQNGYPSRRRSLVDDARFETLVVKQTKQSVLEEARARANGKSFKDEDKSPKNNIDPIKILRVHGNQPGMGNLHFGTN